MAKRDKTPPKGRYQSSMSKDDSKQLTEWLVAVAEKRDKKAFSALFSWFAPKIKNVAYRQFNNEAQALEIVQDTMTNVWRKAHLYHPEKGAATTWIYTVMRNVAFDALRKIQAKKEDLLSDDIWPLVEGEVTETESFSDYLMDKRLLNLVDTLPDNQQQIVRAVYFQDMTQEQLAKLLNIPLGTVKSRLRLALAKLRQQLDDQSQD
ncbi:sigma-70 family RNA polymerase sigma factor [Catenovulum sp. SM1970]|nr:sigma-70 family RNA polymerase sigma factor [Marinifaba aquimaris]